MRKVSRLMMTLIAVASVAACHSGGFVDSDYREQIDCFDGAGRVVYSARNVLVINNRNSFEVRHRDDRPSDTVSGACRIMGQ